MELSKAVEAWYWELVELAYPRPFIVDDFDGTPAYKQLCMPVVHTLSAETVADKLEFIQKNTGTRLPRVLQEVLRLAKERIATAKKHDREIDFLVVGLIRSTGDVALASLTK